MNWSHTKMIYNFHLPLAASHVASGQEHRCGVLEDVDSGRFDTGGGGTGCTSSGGALGWVKRCFFQQKKPVKSGYPPWKLTYPLKIDGWLWWSFLLKWSLCRGTNRAVSRGGVNKRTTYQATNWLVGHKFLAHWVSIVQHGQGPCGQTGLVTTLAQAAEQKASSWRQMWFLGI